MQDEPHRHGHEPQPDGDLGARIAALKARRAAGERARGPVRRTRALQMALRLATDVASGLAVGGVIGWLIDHLAGTLPLFFFLMLVLGGATGVREAIRSMRRLEAEMAAGEEEEERGPRA